MDTLRSFQISRMVKHAGIWVGAVGLVIGMATPGAYASAQSPVARVAGQAVQAYSSPAVMPAAIVRLPVIHSLAITRDPSSVSLLPLGPAAGAAQAASAPGFASYVAALNVVTPQIRRLAAKLRTPQRVFSWVRANVLSEPLWGVTQGAQGCLQTLQCDAQDTAALLASMLAALHVRTRYALGWVRLSVRQLEQAMGGFTSLAGALDLLEESGIPAQEVTDSHNRLVDVLLEEVWVQADLRPSPKRPLRWVSLDAFLKPLRVVHATSVAKLAGGVNEATFRKMAAGATGDPSIPAVTKLNVAAAATAVAGWDKLLGKQFGILAGKKATVGQVLGGYVPAVPAVSALAGPEGTIVGKVTTWATIPASYYHSLTLTVSDGIKLTMPVATLATGQLTIGYEPASAAAAAAISAGGGLYAAAPDTVSLKPLVYLNGAVIATGAAVTMGDPLNVDVTFREPSGNNTTTATHTITAGTFAAVGVSPGTVSGGVGTAQEAPLLATLARLKRGSDTSLENVIGEILSEQAQEYYAFMDAADAVVAGQLGVRVIELPREMLMSFAPTFQYSGSTATPTATVGAGMVMDFRRDIVSLGPANGSESAAAEALLDMTLDSSRFENLIFQVSEQTPAISTVTLLTDAFASGIPVAVVNSHNAKATSAALNLPSAYQEDIESAAVAGYVVLATDGTVTSGDWTGAAWMIINPANGASAYIIAGGLAGSGSPVATPLSGGGTTTESNSIQQVKSAVDGAEPVVSGFILKGRAAEALDQGSKPVSWLLNSGEVAQAMTQTQADTGSSLKAALAGQAQLLVDTATFALDGALVGAGLAVTVATEGAAAIPAGALVGASVATINAVGMMAAQAIIGKIRSLPIQ